MLNDLPSKMIEGQPWVPLLPAQAIEAELQTQNAELKAENATLRATVELVGPALHDYVLAQSRMADNWSEGDAVMKIKLLKDLHFCEPCGREALEALRANAPQPTANPSSSEGSGT